MLFPDNCILVNSNTVNSKPCTPGLCKGRLLSHRGTSNKDLGPFRGDAGI